MSQAAGFYKREGEATILFYAPNSVYMPSGISLLKDNKNTYQYPVEGWSWFEAIEDAYSFHNLEIPKEVEKKDWRLNKPEYYLAGQ